MKNKIIYLVIAAFPFVYACNSSEKKAENEKADSLLNKTCYASSFEKDTAAMDVETYSSEKVKGSLDINYGNGTQNVGTFEGKFSGDTLLVEYKFKLGKDSAAVYTNPLAFLKKDNKLIMGIGEIETAYGRSYFVKGKPINYEKGKFTFEKTDCK